MPKSPEQLNQSPEDESSNSPDNKLKTEKKRAAKYQERLDTEKPISADVVYEKIHDSFKVGFRGVKAREFFLQNMGRIKDTISWDISKENLDLLYNCASLSSSERHEYGVDDETWVKVRDAFLAAATKDLSASQNPEAERLLTSLKFDFIHAF